MSDRAAVLAHIRATEAVVKRLYPLLEDSPGELLAGAAALCELEQRRSEIAVELIDRFLGDDRDEKWLMDARRILKGEVDV